MTHEELDLFLHGFTEQEKENLQKGTVDFDNPRIHREYSKYSTMDKGAYLFEGDYFMNPYENIGVNRQDRFVDIKPHAHNYIELNYVWSGTCVQTIQGRKVVSQQGDVCIFDTSVVHSIEKAGEKDIILNILMRKEFFASAFLARMTKQGILSQFLMEAVSRSQQKKHYLYFPAHNNHRVRKIMEEILLEYYNKDLGVQEVLDSYMVILFTELLRTYRDASKEKEKDVSHNVQILSVLSYIEENYEHCTLSQMAKYFGFNGAYLTNLLKEKTGRSFVEHVQEQRLNKAKVLLENTDLPVTEIVTMCGYNNMNFFYKKFREAVGSTPGDYRKSRT